MNKLLFLLTASLFPFFLNAQLIENFSDGDFLTDPLWQGDTDNFQVNGTLELQLNDENPESSNNSQLLTLANTADNTTWEFLVRQEFSPSTGNFAKIYLKSDSPDLLGDLNGYFVKVGGISGTDDAIELYKQSGSVESLLISGTVAGVGAEPAQARIRVTRDISGNWELFADYSLGTNFQSEGTANDTEHNLGSYFGMTCRYTATRSDKFFFDDISVDPLFEDNIAPSLVSATPISATQVDLLFDEPVQGANITNPTNYLLNSVQTIQSATIDPINATIVHLQLSTPLVSLQNYDLLVTQAEDLAGNSANNLMTQFLFIEAEIAQMNDLIINEIFADPNPAVGLPEFEYIEIYNRSQKTIDLSQLQFDAGSTPGVLSEFLLLPDAYAIICDDSNIDTFSMFGDVVSMTSFPALTNTADVLTVSRISDGGLIDQVSYTSDWYKDEAKDDGGWSLELINPDLNCKGMDIWQASNNPLGGTPGSQNSVFNNTPDNVGPELISGLVISENELTLTFNEPIDQNIDLANAFTISPTVGAIINANFIDNDPNNISITVGAPFFSDATEYTITANNSLTDCIGNSIGASNNFVFTFYLTESPDRYDILINEIFADPTPSIGLPSQEYIELYNNSDKVFNLEDFVIRDLGSDIILPTYILLPGKYVVIYETGGGSFESYNDTLALDDFIGLGNEFDLLELEDPLGNSIHTVLYNIFWYNDNSKSEGGWSLELINPESPCTFSENWSASENENGGTPGFKNSIFNTTTSPTVLDLERVFPNNEQTLRLYFNQTVDITNAENIDNYSVDGLTIQNATVEAPFFSSVLITFTEQISPNQLYEIELRNGITDCIGNPIGIFNSAMFQLPEQAEPNDIKVNEVLFNPETGGFDFVEFFNTSSKAINLADLFLASRDEDSTITSVKEITGNYLLLPDEYVVLTPSPTDIKNRYFVENPRAVIANSLPTLGNKEGTIVLYRAELLGALVIDELAYEEDFHNALLDIKDGVSLERIDPLAITQDRSNWHSASEQVGYATPSYLNSQFKSNQNAGLDMISLPNDVFSPDADGFDDFLFINYTTEKAGFLANIKVFDSNGREVKSLINNELLANEGTFKWDGDREDGTKARIGIYVLWIELFHPDGDIFQVKETCVVAGQLE